MKKSKSVASTLKCMDGVYVDPSIDFVENASAFNRIHKFLKLVDPLLRAGFDFPFRVGIVDYTSNFEGVTVKLDDGLVYLMIALNPEEPLSADDLYELVCHEMVHVRQYARGDLEFVQEPKALYWKGQDITHMFVNGLVETLDFDEYANLPWEREAFDAQEKDADDLAVLMMQKYGFEQLKDMYI